MKGHVAGSTVSLYSLWRLNVKDGQQIITGKIPELLWNNGHLSANKIRNKNCASKIVTVPVGEWHGCVSYIYLYYILICIQQDAKFHSLFYLETALHILGGTIFQRQERKQLYIQHLVFVTPLLPPAAIVEELELVWVCCGYATHSTLKPVATLAR